MPTTAIDDVGGFCGGDGFGSGMRIEFGPDELRRRGGRICGIAAGDWIQNFDGVGFSGFEMDAAELGFDAGGEE